MSILLDKNLPNMYTVGVPGFDGGPLKFNVLRDEKQLHSFDTAHHSDSSPAYSVELSKQYDRLPEAAAAQNELYKNSSLAKSDRLQELMKKDTDSLRSMASYAGISREQTYRGEAVDEDNVKNIWADFQNDSTYKKMAAQGGTLSQNDVDELVAAAESYNWQTRYKAAGIYDQNFFDFADKIKQNTGVSLVTNGNSYNITKSVNGLLLRVDDYAFQTMAQHQDHMDLWENLANGTYSSYDELTAAVNATKDESLIADWRIASTCFGQGNFRQEFNHDVYARYANVSRSMDTDYDTSTSKGTTAKDFWQEINYNLHLTDDYHSQRDYGEYYENGRGAGGNHYSVYTDFAICDRGNLPGFYRLDDDGNLRNPFTNEMHKTKEQWEEEKKKSWKENHLSPVEQQIKTLQKNIKNIQKKLAAMQTFGLTTEHQQNQAASYKQQIASYQQQIHALQSRQLDSQSQNTAE